MPGVPGNPLPFIAELWAQSDLIDVRKLVLFTCGVGSDATRSKGAWWTRGNLMLAWRGRNLQRLFPTLVCGCDVIVAFLFVFPTLLLSCCCVAVVLLFLVVIGCLWLCCFLFVANWYLPCLDSRHLEGLWLQLIFRFPQQLDAVLHVDCAMV